MHVPPDGLYQPDLYDAWLTVELDGGDEELSMPFFAGLPDDGRWVAEPCMCWADRLELTQKSRLTGEDGRHSLAHAGSDRLGGGQILLAG